LHRIGAVGRLVHHQWDSAAVIEEVDAHAALASSVGGCEAAVEVGEEVDGRAVELSGGEDAWHFDADVGFCVWGCEFFFRLILLRGAEGREESEVRVK
jgi:hypothetical protein